jgi:hypothetical protein
MPLFARSACTKSQSTGMSEPTRMTNTVAVSDLDRLPAVEGSPELRPHLWFSYVIATILLIQPGSEHR